MRKMKLKKNCIICRAFAFAQCRSLSLFLSIALLHFRLCMETLQQTESFCPLEKLQFIIKIKTRSWLLIHLYKCVCALCVCVIFSNEWTENHWQSGTRWQQVNWRGSRRVENFHPYNLRCVCESRRCRRQANCIAMSDKPWLQLPAAPRTEPIK